MASVIPGLCKYTSSWAMPGGGGGGVLGPLLSDGGEVVESDMVDVLVVVVMKVDAGVI